MEFYSLLLTTFLMAVVVSLIVIFAFRKSIKTIFMRIIGEDIAIVWEKFLVFALLVVGIASGVNIRMLERFIAPATEQNPTPELTTESWVLELFRTMLNSLGGLAWALLIFFLVALITYVIVKGREKKLDG